MHTVIVNRMSQYINIGVSDLVNSSLRFKKKYPFVLCKDPRGTLRKNDAVLTSMRHIDVDTTSFWHHMPIGIRRRVCGV